MLTLRTVSTRIEVKGRHQIHGTMDLLCQASRIQGWHVAGWPAECEHSKARRGHVARPLHIFAAWVHNPPFEQNFCTRLHPVWNPWHFCGLTCRTPFHPLWKYKHLYEGFGERFVGRLWHSTFCKTLLKNTSGKSFCRLSLRLGFVNKTISYTLSGQHFTAIVLEEKSMTYKRFEEHSCRIPVSSVSQARQ